MKNKKTLKMLLTLCAAFILMGGFSVTAYAQVPEGADDATDDSGVVYEEPQKEEPLTENTVHFLNQVDEADLMALMEDGETKTEPPAVCNCTDKCEAGKVNVSCPVCSTNMTACSGKAAEPETEEPTEQPEKKNNTGGLFVFLIVALLGGGGAFYYFKVMKPKQDVKGGTDLDDFDFDDYDEDEPEADEEAGDDGGTEDDEE